MAAGEAVCRPRIDIRIPVDEGARYRLGSITFRGNKAVPDANLKALRAQFPLKDGEYFNFTAFGKGLREMKEWGLIPRLPRLAVIQAEGSAPFYQLMESSDHTRLEPVAHPETLATAIKIGDPVSWPKALHEIYATNGVVRKVTEQEIADAKAMIGRSGIGCEPASAATLAGIRKLAGKGTIRNSDKVVAILTGNVLKDPDYIYRYHTDQLKTGDGTPLKSTFGNRPIVADYRASALIDLIQRLDSPAPQLV